MTNYLLALSSRHVQNAPRLIQLQELWEFVETRSWQSVENAIVK